EVRFIQIWGEVAPSLFHRIQDYRGAFRSLSWKLFLKKVLIVLQFRRQNGL
ncbi:unnamed protein product, partial [Brassica oleracea var. botrytis]